MQTVATPNLTIANMSAVKHSGRDYVRIVVPSSGTVNIEQNDQRLTFGGGSFAFYDSTIPLRIGGDENYAYTMISLPRASVANLVPHLRNLAASKFDLTSPSVRVFMKFAQSIEQNAAAFGARQLEVYEPTLVDMFSNAVMLTTGGPPKLSHVQREQIMRRLRSRLRDPGLELTEISAAEGVSVRSMQRLFQEIGTTPWKWVMENRLQGVAHDLRSAAYARKSVTEIAFSWGLSDPAYFSRSFKARFGCTPSAWRKM